MSQINDLLKAIAEQHHREIAELQIAHAAEVGRLKAMLADSCNHPAQYYDGRDDMPKPDWSRAPEWAQWWAVDEDGSAYWFDSMPFHLSLAAWHKSDEHGLIELDRYICDDGIYENWMQSLHHRPSK